MIWTSSGTKFIALAALLALASGAAARYYVRIVSSSGDTDPLIVALVASGAHLVSPAIPRLELQIDPQPEAMPQITWGSQNAQRVQVMQGLPWFHEMRLPGDTSRTPAPPANQINAIPGSEPGFTWVSAGVGAPVNLRISIPAYAYHTLAVGCAMGFSPGAAFNGKPAHTIAESDIYVTGPAPPPQGFFAPGCSPAFATQETNFTLHVPYGGITFPSRDFARIRVADWRNDFTDVPETSGSLGLIFRTHDGKFVKVQYATDGRTNGAFTVAAATGEFPDILALRGMHTHVEAIGAMAAPRGFFARIDYEDPIASTTGIATALFTELPLPVRTPFMTTPPAATIVISPQPYDNPQVTWLLDGNQIAQAPLTSPVPLSIARSGRSTLTAQVGPPVSQTLKIPVITYDSLVVGCGIAVQGVRFVGDRAVPAADAKSSDVFISSDPNRFACGSNPALYFPGGGVLLTNGHDASHRIPKGAVAGPQFPGLTRMLWQKRATRVSIDTWRAMDDPCTMPVSPGVVRINYDCNTVPAQTLLFRTRGGAYVKLLLVHANGTSIMGGPYQMLSE